MLWCRYLRAVTLACETGVYGKLGAGSTSGTVKLSTVVPHCLVLAYPKNLFTTFLSDQTTDRPSLHTRVPGYTRVRVGTSEGYVYPGSTGSEFKRITIGEVCRNFLVPTSPVNVQVNLYCLLMDEHWWQFGFF